MDNTSILGRQFEPGRVFGGVTYTPAHIEAPGLVVHTGNIERYVWGATQSTLAVAHAEKIEYFQNLLLESGIAAEYTTNAEVTMWSKLCTKASFDAVTVLGRYDLGTMISHESTRKLYMSAMQEVMGVESHQIHRFTYFPY